MEIRRKPLHHTVCTLLQGMEVMSAKQKYVSEPPTNLSHWSEMKYEMKFTK